jgi:hypothetical protein
MKFSQRIGKTPSTRPIQIDSIDEDLRNGLWNAAKVFILDNLDKTYNGFRGNSTFDTFCDILWHNFYKLPVDDIPFRQSNSIAFIRESFFNSEWYEIYDFLEFINQIHFDYINLDFESFKSFCNATLERDFAGYRFIDNKISPITNEHEIQEIEQSIINTKVMTSLKGANIHLNKALDKLSDRKNPDYRNSIKESISAIESVAKIISNQSKDSLGVALDKIKSKIKLHPALEKGFKQIYGYTSDSDGIRHALIEEHSCDFEDAKYMLVSSSAFINYLIVKADKAGIKL